jgi:flagellar hook assembly protein FlgD
MIVTVEDGGELPDGYTLYQNYPNPFNPSTSISFALPSSTNLSLVVYNALGQEVVRLIDNQDQPAGTFQVVWDGSDFSGRNVSTGVYFYQLQTNDRVLTRKMILVK